MADFVQDFFTSRQNYSDGDTRIGQLDRLWYDSKTNTIRISDGVTPGGIIVTGGTSIVNWVTVSSNYTAANGQKIIADTSGGSWTLSLPGSPTVGSYIQVFGSDFNTNNLIVDGNGSTIEGLPGTINLTDSNSIYDFIYNGTTWQLISGGGGGLGTSGYSGYSGLDGASGYSGISGYSGESGVSGYSGLGLSPWTRITSNYYAQNGNRLIADTEGGSFLIFLPATPVTGDYIQITDGWDFALNNCFVDPNGNTIEGMVDVVALDLKGVTFEFIYDGTTWEVTGTTGARGQSGFSGYSGISGLSGEGLTQWILTNNTYYAINNDRLIANTQLGSFTIFLPATPVTGDYIQITDGWDFAINNCFVDPNGNTIEGMVDVVALDLKGVTFEFIYDGTTWEVTGTTGARGQSGFSGYSGYGSLPVTIVTGTYQLAISNNQYVITNIGTTTIDLPATPVNEDTVWITVANDLITNVVGRNGNQIMGLSEDMIIDNAYANVRLRYIDNTYQWRLV